jgi:hypothetical protein
MAVSTFPKKDLVNEPGNERHISPGLWSWRFRTALESQGFLANQLILHLTALACSFDLPLELGVCIGQRAYAGSQDR